MKKPLECDVLVIGGGVAGLSTAYHLGQGPGKLRILVVEGERKLGGHASGRNAGMIRQALSDPMLVRLAREGREALEQAGTLPSWKKLGLKAAGSLLLDSRKNSPELRATAKSLLSEGIATTALQVKDVQALVPILGQEKFEEALFCPSDAVLDIRELIAGFERELSKQKTRIVYGSPIRSIQKKGAIFLVETASQIFHAQVIVNAAGAWASEIARLAGASDVPLSAYRRHLFEAASLPGVSRRSPFVWHVSRGYYFRPLSSGFLISPCDKTAVDVSARAGKKGFEGEVVDPAMAKQLMEKLTAISPKFSQVRLSHARSGLRTMTPDGRFVIGTDPKQFGFFWVAGLGGHGVTTCFSVGRLAADLISGRKVDAKLQKAFAPGRFQ